MPKARANRRGSPEAIEKRRAARAFNDVLGGGAAGPRLDGRTEKRRQRLLRELEEASAGARELKPLDVLQRVQQLLELGETVTAIRKVARPRRPQVTDGAMVEVVERLHKAYRFRPETYRFVGIGDEVLRSAGVLGDGKGARRARA